MLDRTHVSASEDFEDLFENSPCGYLSLHPDGMILKANRTFLTWTGFEADELRGRRFQELLNIAGRIYYETHFAPLLRMQGFFNEVALDLAAKDGRRVSVLVNATERRNAEGDHLFTRLTVFNATDRRRYERELLEARERAEKMGEELRHLNEVLEQRVRTAVEQQLRVEEALRQSQKMEAVGQLTSGVAHDFNNLLTLIIGGLDVIRRQLEAPLDETRLARIRTAREMANHGARRAATLTARLLALSRQQALAPKTLNPNRLVSELADLLQRTLGETVAFEVIAAAGVWSTFVDPGELENALINLAVNARDAMPNGGRLTIETSNARLDDAYVAQLHEPIASGDYVLIAVSDTGQGMERETLARVFEPFFTTKALGKGTGLGLAQVYGFVRQSNGHVRIYSEVGLGTTVKMYLPRAQSHERDAPSGSQTPRITGGAETILVVEDDEEVRAYTVGALQELGYSVEQARSAQQALDLLEQTPQIALLFTDLVLPDGENGKQLAEQALRRRPNLKVLYTSGYATNAILHRSQLSSAAQFLSKPYTYDELAAKCRALLDG